MGGVRGRRRDQGLATDRWVSQGGAQRIDRQRAVQASPGEDLGEGVLTSMHPLHNGQNDFPEVKMGGSDQSQ